MTNDADGLLLGWRGCSGLECSISIKNGSLGAIHPPSLSPSLSRHLSLLLNPTFLHVGFKRAFGVKDFGDTLPGHGGMTDRVDCQLMMAMFSYVWYQAFVADITATFGEVLDLALRLGPEDQVSGDRARERGGEGRSCSLVKCLTLVAAVSNKRTSRTLPRADVAASESG